MNLLIPPPLPEPLAALLAVLVITAAFFDLRSRKIPNWLSTAGCLAGLAGNAALSDWAGVRTALLGFGLAFGVYLGLYLLHAMGAGDVKLMAAAGAVAGWRAWLLIFLATSLIGAVLAILLAVSKGRLKSTFWNVGYLVRELASFRAPWLTHEQLDVKNPTSLRLPHAVSIALGSLAMLAAAQWR